MQRLLVVGSTGLVGSKVVSLAKHHDFESYHTTNLHQSALPRSRTLDIRDGDETMRLVAEVQPHVIINAAALTNVDYCELHKREANEINIGGTINLCNAARVNGSRLIQISTDSVFDGTRGNYVESDATHPVNYYSTTKVQGEKFVSELSNYAIARPSVIYGWHTRKMVPTLDSTKAMNFAMFVLDTLKRGLHLKAITDQFSCPTLVDDLAEALLRLGRSTSNGIFHTAGRTCLSRYDFAVLVAKQFDQPTELISAVSSSDFPQVAPRPRNCCLQVAKAEQTLGIHFSTAEEGIRTMFRQAKT